jgi:hypothetical protein
MWFLMARSGVQGLSHRSQSLAQLIQRLLTLTGTESVPNDEVHSLPGMLIWWSPKESPSISMRQTEFGITER